MVARPLFGIISFILLAGGILLQFFIILSGTVEHSPINQFYFLETTTNGIPDARNPARWTYFSVCGVDDAGHNTNCHGATAAQPFDPPNGNNFGTTVGVPEEFIGTSKYFLESRFMWVFWLIALVFAAIAFLTSGLALCTRLGSYISAVNTAIAWFFATIAAALQTAWVVQGRNIFRNNGQDASVGVKMMAFAWTIFACYFLATITFCIGGGRRKDRDSGAYAGTSSHRTSGGTFGRKRSVRSNRGSFGNDSRIKDDYA